MYRSGVHVPTRSTQYLYGVCIGYTCYGRGHSLYTLHGMHTVSQGKARSFEHIKAEAARARHSPRPLTRALQRGGGDRGSVCGSP